MPLPPKAINPSHSPKICHLKRSALGHRENSVSYFLFVFISRIAIGCDVWDEMCFIDTMFSLSCFLGRVVLPFVFLASCCSSAFWICKMYFLCSQLWLPPDIVICHSFLSFLIPPFPVILCLYRFQSSSTQPALYLQCCASGPLNSLRELLRLHVQRFYIFINRRLEWAVTQNLCNEHTGENLS